MRQPSGDDNDEANELSEPSRTAVHLLRERPVPQDALARSLTQAIGLELRGNEALPGHGGVRRPTRPIRPWRKRMTRGAWALAVVLLAAVLLPTAWRVSEPTTSWAQVVAAVRGRPWILFFEDVDDPRRFEVWCDQTRQRFCFRREKWFHFVNLQTRVYEIYDAEQNVLTARRSIPRDCSRKESAACKCSFG